MKIVKLNIFFLFIALYSSNIFAESNNYKPRVVFEQSKFPILAESVSLENEVKIESIEYIDNKDIKLTVNIPNGYYAYLKSKIANKINIYPLDKSKLLFDVEYPEGREYKKDIIIDGRKEFLLKIKHKKEGENYDIVLSYQLCKEVDNICLTPKESIINFSVKNKVITINSINERPSSSKVVVDNNSLVSKIKNNNNLLLTIFLIFLAGIGSVLLPCTYPLISITISVIGINDKEGKRDTKQSIISSMLFCLGIITTYTLLGAIVSIAGSIMHKNILFGSIGYNPIVLFFIVSLFLYFTFSMAGFYDIKIPNFLNQIKNDAYNKNKNSVLHKYIIGLITGIVATPCAAPVIALILEIGFLNPSLAIAYMATYAFGFSFVLFILSISISTLMNKLPKAGVWMNYIRFIFSFVMLLVSYYYLHILLQNIGVKKLSPMLTGSIIFVISFLVFFILNKKEKILLSTKEIKIFFTMLVVSVILATTYTTIKKMSVNDETINLKDAITLSQNTNKKILIDFSATWCANCYLLEKNVLTSPIMKNYMENNNYILVKVDVDKNPELSQEFNIKWLPWIVVIDSNKNVLYTKNSFESFDDKTSMQIIKELENLNITNY